MTGSLRRGLPTVLLLVVVVFFLFTARIIYSPLLLAIEESLSLSHAGAASFFLFITLGYSLMMLFSGYVAARLKHRWVILLAVLVACLGLAVIAVSRRLAMIRLGLVLLGGGSGLYFPSGVPTITSLVDSGDEGKVIALHEVGPNAAFVFAPILAALLLPVASWRAMLLLIACFGLLAGLAFWIFAKGGRFHGQSPHPEHARTILGRPSFWIMTCLFALGAGAGLGVFALTPTYLAAERGLDPRAVNTLVGLSRLSSLGPIFFVGYLADRIGVEKTIAPRRLHNLTISFLFPMSYAFGAGLVPYLFGLLGDRLSFAAGFLIYGLLLMAASVLPFLLRLEPAGAQPEGRPVP